MFDLKKLAISGRIQSATPFLDESIIQNNFRFPCIVDANTKFYTLPLGISQFLTFIEFSFSFIQFL